jgi:hypothetical protein
MYSIIRVLLTYYILCINNKTFKVRKFMNLFLIRTIEVMHIIKSE